MSTSLSHQVVEFACDSIMRFTHTLLGITQHSSHSHETTVNRLLHDLAELVQSGKLDNASYHTVLGKGADVADFFNYDIELLRHENNSWYRASVIHQMGQGMLQALEHIRPDLTSLPFFAEAIAGLSMARQTKIDRHTRVPVTCRHWSQSAEQEEQPL